MRNCRFHMGGNDNEVVIGSNVKAVDAEFWIEDSGNRIVIGDGTSLCGKVHFACIEGTAIEVGRDCLFSSGIVFRTGDSHSITDMEGNRINPSCDIAVGDHVWIGYGATVLKDVEIKGHTIVATEAVVTKSPAEGNAVLAGNPARIVKKGIDWDAERMALEK